MPSEHLHTAHQEIRHAVHWQHGLALIFIYRSEYLRQEAAETLQAWLQKDALPVQHLRVTPSHYDIIKIAQQVKPPESVFFVRHLRWGGGKRGLNAYRALNQRREDIQKHRLKFVFWLTREEARRMLRAAPDFWAFRHATYDISSLPPSGAIHLDEQPVWMPIPAHVRASARLDAVSRPENLQAALKNAALPPEAQSILWHNLGILFFQKNDFARAQQCMEKAVQTNPGHVDIPRNAALTAIWHGDYAAAENFAAALSRQMPQNSAAQNAAGEIYYLLGDWEDALTLFRRALRLDGQHPAALYYQGRILSDYGRHADALRLLRKAARLAPQRREIFQVLGDVYRRNGQEKAARAAYAAARRLSPFDETANLHPAAQEKPA